MRRWLRVGASLAVLLGTLFFLDWQALGDALRRISLAGLAGAFAATLAVFGVLAWRWHLLVQPLAPRTVLEHLRLYLLATYLNSFTPANLGGDAYRVVSLRSAETATAVLLVAVLRERFVGLLSYLLAYLALFLALAAGGAPVAALFVSAAAAIAAAALAMLVAPWLVTAPALRLDAVAARPLLKGALEVLDQGARMGSASRLIALLGVSFLGLALWIAAVKIVALDLGVPVAWPALGAIVVLAELVRMLPFTVQGLGLREITFAYLVSLLGGPPESGFMLGAVSYAVLTLALLACGAIGWLLPHADRARPE